MMRVCISVWSCTFYKVIRSFISFLPDIPERSLKMTSILMVF